MWLVAIYYERMSPVPPGESIVRIAVPIIAVACALDAPCRSAFIESKDESLWCVAACDKRTAQQLRNVDAVIVHNGKTVAVALKVPYKCRIGITYAICGCYAGTHCGNAEEAAACSLVLGIINEV